ncbi:MAG: DUF1997 domain-containing protein, partial [Cyanothece sp. SIO1E1]|nr:DUF1997 domain-containing protein [Cyanothece sp. SIO1E1]
MLTQFAASESVEIAVCEQRIPIKYYLCKPQRVIDALVDPSRVELLDDEFFRLNMRPLRFILLEVQPIVDLKVWPASDGSIHLRSTRSEIRGNAYINRRFHLDLIGELRQVESNGVTCLHGQAD